MRIFVLVVAAVCLHFTAHTQSQSEIIGQVTSMDQEPLIGVTVILIAASDSSMISFGITNTDGKYRLEDIAGGEFLIQLSFLSYKTIYIPIEVNSAEDIIDVGKHVMEAQSELLTEVTIEADRIPLGVQGDTIVYNTSAFKTRAGASVEDLLKQLPGIEVARDGSIKAQGEDVENVLVDGKEFFGNDPTIATKNLEAEAVDKIEVFDKASEMAEFTGVDDGQDQKTINLKLKEDYKTGGFGRVNVAGGPEGRYQGKLNYNRFSPNLQASTILSNNNINEQAFSFNDYINMMGGLSNAIANSGGIMNFGEFGSNQPSQGIANNLSGGMNFNYDFSSKLELKSHYLYLRNDKNIDLRSIGTLFDTNVNYNSERQSLTNSLGQNHVLQSKLLYKPNPLLQVLFKNNVTGVFNDNSELSNTSFSSVGISSTTMSDFSTMSNQIGYDGHLQLRKKYVKKGRNWISDIKYKSGNIRQENLVLNEINLGINSQLVNQLQTYDSREQDLIVRSKFTNPLGNKQYLSLSYELNQNIETPAKFFFDRIQSELIQNSLLSASFKKNVIRHTPMISYRYNGSKFKSSIGLSTQWSQIKNKLLDVAQEINSKAFNVLPSISAEYKFTSYKSLSLDYTTRVNLPTLAQLTPMPENTDPNLLITGNPKLNPEYSQRVGFNFSSFDNFSQRNFFAYGSYMNIRDKIINAVTIDENFLRTVSPINTDGYNRIDLNASYSAPIRPLKIKYSFRVDFNLAHYETQLNNTISGVIEDGANLSFSIENRKKNFIDLRGGIKYNLSHRRYSLNADFNQTFSNYALYVDATIETNNGWSLNSAFDWNSFSNESFSMAETFNLWNASIRKSFKEDQYAISLNVFDILGQNVGLSRNGGLNSLNETRFNTLTRYIMLGFSYKLGRQGQKGDVLQLSN